MSKEKFKPMLTFPELARMLAMAERRLAYCETTCGRDSLEWRAAHHQVDRILGIFARDGGNYVRRITDKEAVA